MNESNLDTQFKPGEVVRLKSGGPDMTISAEDRHLRFCVWFDRNKFMGELISIRVLEKVTDRW